MAGLPPSNAASWDSYQKQTHASYHSSFNPFFSQSQPPAPRPLHRALPPQQLTLDRTVVPPPRKSKQHRKRHVPVGPAGNWFLAQQDHHTAHDNSQRRPKLTGTPSQDERDDDDRPAGWMPSKQSPSNNKRGSFFSSAWMCMQCRLGFVTPALPANLSPEERAPILRRYVPEEYLLLPQVLSIEERWKVPKRLLVVVQRIQSLADNLWTVELTDETSAVVDAWIQPRLVREEQQRPQPMYIRPGLVWLLNEPTVMLVVGEKEQPGADAVRLDRMLLIDVDSIEQVWSPAQAEKEVSDEDYVRWMEKRNTLTMAARQEQPMQQDDDEEEPIEENEMVQRPRQDESSGDEAEFTFGSSPMTSLPTTGRPASDIRNENHQPRASQLAQSQSSQLILASRRTNEILAPTLSAPMSRTPPSSTAAHHNGDDDDPEPPVRDFSQFQAPTHSPAVPARATHKSTILTGPASNTTVSKIASRGTNPYAKAPPADRNQVPPAARASAASQTESSAQRFNPYQKPTQLMTTQSAAAANIPAPQQAVATPASRPPSKTQETRRGPASKSSSKRKRKRKQPAVQEERPRPSALWTESHGLDADMFDDDDDSVAATKSMRGTPVPYHAGTSENDASPNTTKKIVDEHKASTSLFNAEVFADLNADDFSDSDDDL